MNIWCKDWTQWYLYTFCNIWSYRQCPEVYDLCHTFLHVARVKKTLPCENCTRCYCEKKHCHARIARVANKHKAMRESHGFLCFSFLRLSFALLGFALLCYAIAIMAESWPLAQLQVLQNSGSLMSEFDVHKPWRVRNLSARDRHWRKKSLQSLSAAI